MEKTINHRESPGNSHDGGRNSHSYLSDDLDHDTVLSRMRTAGSISISPELFEKIYLSPKNKVKKDLRQTFGNPTPLALLGFLLCLTPLSNALMGWRGAGGSGAADVGVFLGFGGLCMVLGGLGEWILGNTFPFVVFTSFGAYWLSFAFTLIPFYNASIAYDPSNPTAAATNAEFAATFAYFLLYMGLLCFVYLICSLRTNLCFFAIFFCLVLAFTLLAAAYFQTANGNFAVAAKLQKAGGAFAFICCLFGWYIFFVQMLASVDFPLSLPVFDLSSIVRGASERAGKGDIEKAE